MTQAIEQHPGRPGSGGGPRAPGRLVRRWGWVLPAVLVALLYLPVRGFEFVGYDDYAMVLENPQVRAGLTPASVRWAFTSTEHFNWHPLTWLSHMLDVELFGMHPGGHHVTSVGLHAINSALVTLLLSYATARPLTALLGGLLFAVHPLRLESVAWVAERKDVLCAFFWLGALLAYVAGARAQSPGRARTCVGAVLVLHAAALMAKPMAVTLPICLLLLDYWPLRRPAGDARRLLVTKIPFLMLSAAAGWITLHAQAAGGAVASVDRLGVQDRAAGALVFYTQYLLRTFWPSPLAVFHPRPTAFPIVQVVLAAALLIAVSYAAHLARRRAPAIAMGWLWFLVVLLPVIGLVQVGGQGIADRYTYMPSVGLVCAVVFGVAELLPERRFRRWAWAGGACAALVLAVATRVEMQWWHDSFRLFGHALAVTQGNYLAHNNLGAALQRSGRPLDAMAHFRRAASIRPSYANAHFNLGVLQQQGGAVTDAIDSYSRALNIDNDYLQAHYNIAVALEQMGTYTSAVWHFSEAVRLAPGHYPARWGRANCRARMGEWSAAIEDYRAVLALRPDLHAARVNLAIVLGHAADPDGARRELETVLRAVPDHADARAALARIQAAH